MYVGIEVVKLPGTIEDVEFIQLTIIGLDCSFLGLLPLEIKLMIWMIQNDNTVADRVVIY